jgi:hypothetical protein
METPFPSLYREPNNPTPIIESSQKSSIYIESPGHESSRDPSDVPEVF